MISKSAVNSTYQVAVCPKCGQTGSYIDECGVYRCKNCMIIIETVIDKTVCSYNESNQVKLKASGTILTAANDYGFSPRRAYYLAKQGKFLNIKKEHGTYLFHGDPGEISGPLADTPQEVRLPRGTGEISAEVHPASMTSSRIRCLFFDPSYKRPWAVLRADTGFSGVHILINIMKKI